MMNTPLKLIVVFVAYFLGTFLAFQFCLLLFWLFKPVLVWLGSGGFSLYWGPVDFVWWGRVEVATFFSSIACGLVCTFYYCKSP